MSEPPDTTLAALKQAFGPKPGMRRLPLPLESYEHRSKPLSDKRLLNLYSEAAPGDARTQAALVSSPGLVHWATLGDGPIWAINSDLPGRIYVASGEYVWRLSPDGVGPPELIGHVGVIDPVGTPQQITIAVGATAVVVCVPPRAYTCAHNVGDVLNQIGGTFPGASSVAFLDGYFLFTSTERSSRFFISKLLDPTVYDALDFAYADALPNVIDLVIPHRGEVWLCGEAGIEIWIDTGDLDFPFRRQSGGIIPYGVISPRTVARGDGSVWWVGVDDVVYRSDGFQARAISTPPVVEIIRTYSGYTAAAGLFYSQGGHSFYVLSFADRTIVYDCATKLWHDRSSGLGGVGRWRPQSVGRQSDALLFGDYATSELWTADPDGKTDAGALIFRSFTMAPVWGSTNRLFMNRLEVEMEVGGALSPGDVTVDWSDDGGWNYGPVRTMNAGGVSERGKRVFTTRLGSFHQRVLRVSALGHVTFYGVDADITAPLGGG